MTPSGLLPKAAPFSSAGVLQASVGALGRECTEPGCVLPRAEFPSTFLRELGAPGLAGLGTKRDSVWISQIKSAGSLYGHSNRFTDARKLKSTVYVCRLSPRKVSMSTLQGLCTHRFSASVLILLTASSCQRAPRYSAYDFI